MSAGARLRALQLDALARRLAAQPEPVRAILEARVAQGRAALAAQPAQESAAAARVTPPAPKIDWPQAPRPSAELASVGRFRRAWSRTRAQDSVTQAAAQRPANAGPLNSQVLVLQSLDLMGQLSADYLRRFIAHAESLLWLEAVGAQAPTPAARKPKRRG